MLKTENNNLRPEAMPVLTMPEELRKFVLTNCTNPSPYNRYESGSFYDCTDKSWDYTPHGSIRVSDHWNFYSHGKMHCITNIDDSRIEGKWVVAKYDSYTGMYNVISIDGKDCTALEKHSKRSMAKREIIDPNSLKQKRLGRAIQIRKEKQAKERAKKIRNGAKGNKGTKIWVEVNVNVWAGSGRRVRFAGTETIIGYLTWESKTGNSFCIKSNGVVREIRKYNSYKEFKRKPKNI